MYSQILCLSPLFVHLPKCRYNNSFSIDNVSGISATKLEQNLDLSDLDNEIYILTNPYYNGAAGMLRTEYVSESCKGYSDIFLVLSKKKLIVYTVLNRYNIYKDFG